MEDVFIGLGSNMGDRLDNLLKAERGLAEFVVITGRSKIYETAPQYVTDQPKFLNSVLRGTPQLDPRPLLEALKQLEIKLGRRPGLRNGPRLVDLDILYFGDRCVETNELTLPHPRIHERYFVLKPLVDIEPARRHPVSGKTMRQLLDELPLGSDRGAVPISVS
ncbi:MAG: 2-amino-4-hydroxy-6-hydroxymethyldihydropteridine diphosphokinase [Proteobacteria bacterium]|nr:2-amino-4-hydroxy-6-hydroxymethyldihydropteridine diphosphokinase [Pseudomonadota bacterium]